MSFTKRTLTPVVNLIGDPLFNFDNPYIQNGVISGQYYTNQQTSYGLPKPSFLQITPSSNVVTVVANGQVPLRLIFAYGIHDANTGGEVGAWRTFTAKVLANSAITVTPANTSWIYAEVNENGQPNNPNAWTIDFGHANSLGRTYTTGNVQPTSPVGNDVWFDFANNKLEVYNSDAVAWQVKRRVYLGQVAKGGDDYIYTVETWFPDLEYARYQNTYYAPYYLNPWRHFDGVSFLTNGQFIAAEAANWRGNVSIVQAVTGNKIAMNAVANSHPAQQLVGNSQVFLDYVANSTVALSSIANSAIAANLMHILLANNYVTISNNLVVNSIAAITNSITGPIIATGGNTVTDIVEGDTIYRVHTFTGSGTFTVHSVGSEANTVEYLIVAGGGSGASDYYAGGGGAGGLIEGKGFPVSIGSYPIIVGGGGSVTGRVAVAPLGPTGPVAFPYVGGGPGPSYYGNVSGANSSAFGFQAMGGGGGRHESDAAYYQNTIVSQYTNQTNTGAYYLGGSGGGMYYTTGPAEPWLGAGNGIIGQGHSGGGFRRTPFYHRGVRVGGSAHNLPQAQGLNPTAYAAGTPFASQWGYPLGLNPVMRPHAGGHGSGFNPTMGNGHGGGGGGGAGSDGHATHIDGIHGTKTNSQAAGNGGKGVYSRITGTLVGYAGGGGGGSYWYATGNYNHPSGTAPVGPTVMNKTLADNAANAGIGTEGGGSSVAAPGTTSNQPPSAPAFRFTQSGSGTANRGGGGAGAVGTDWGPFGPTAPTGSTYGPAGPVWYAPGAYGLGGAGGSGIVVIRYPIAKNADRWNKARKLNVEYLIVAGGGGGGSQYGGGGGAGGFKTNVPGATNGGGHPLDPAMTLIEGVLYPVVVGAGGVGDIDYGRTKATQGNDSQFAQITAIGGAYAWHSQQAQSWGGSGAGRGHSHHEAHQLGPAHAGNPPTQWHGTPGPQYGPSYFYPNFNRSRSVGLQGYPGGIGGIMMAGISPHNPPVGLPPPSFHGSGGGGGAGGQGGDIPADTTNYNALGQGGAGLASPISGTPVVYAGGGAGGYHNGYWDGANTQNTQISLRGNPHPAGGGGGAAAYAQYTPLYGVIAQSGTANRGGGGGGGSNNPGGNWGNSPNSGVNSPAIDAPTSPFFYYGRYGGAGGSGIVVIRIPRDFSAVFSPGVTVSNSTAVANAFVYTVTATSTTTETVKFTRND